MFFTSRNSRAGHSVAYVLLIAVTLPVAVFALNGLDLVRDFLLPFVTGRAVNDDAFIYIWPYLDPGGAAVFAGDPLAAHATTAQAPQGYDLFFRALGAVVDARRAAIVVGVLLYAVLFVYAIRTAHLIAGLPGAVCTCFILLGSVYLLVYMNGALPRSFGPPLIAMALYGLVSGRLRHVMLATVLGTLFYYMVGVVSGLALLFYCLMPAGWRPATADLSLARRATLLAVTGAVSLAILASSMTRDHAFGPVVGPVDYAAFPEAGPDGRYWAEWRNVAVDMADISMSTFDAKTRQGGGDGNLLRAAYLSVDRIADALRTELGLGLLLGLAVMVALSPRRDTAGFLCLVAASCLLYLAAAALFPLLFFPTRFFQTVMPIVVAVMAGWAGRRLFRRYAPSVPDPGQAAVMVLAVSLVLIATGRPQWARLTAFSDTERAVFAFIRDLPEDTLIAGWPRDQVIDAVPYHGERRILLSHETHQSFREDFILLTRARMQALIEALVAGSPEAFETLRDRFGVTHILVNEPLLARGDLTYFAPFQDRLDAIGDQSAGVALLRSGALGPVVLDAGDRFLVDLAPDPSPS
jgi:hypothetical protein